MIVKVRFVLSPMNIQFRIDICHTSGLIVHQVEKQIDQLGINNVRLNPKINEKNQL